MGHAAGSDRSDPAHAESEAPAPAQAASATTSPCSTRITRGHRQPGSFGAGPQAPCHSRWPCFQASTMARHCFRKSDDLRRRTDPLFRFAISSLSISLRRTNDCATQHDMEMIGPPATLVSAGRHACASMAGSQPIPTGWHVRFQARGQCPDLADTFKKSALWAREVLFQWSLSDGGAIWASGWWRRRHRSTSSAWSGMCH